MGTQGDAIASLEVYAIEWLRFTRGRGRCRRVRSEVSKRPNYRFPASESGHARLGGQQQQRCWFAADARGYFITTCRLFDVLVHLFNDPLTRYSFRSNCRLIRPTLQNNITIASSGVRYIRFLTTFKDSAWERTA